jgi:hypothetical protein
MSNEEADVVHPRNLKKKIQEKESLIFWTGSKVISKYVVVLPAWYKGVRR